MGAWCQCRIMWPRKRHVSCFLQPGNNRSRGQLNNDMRCVHSGAVAELARRLSVQKALLGLAVLIAVCCLPSVASASSMCLPVYQSNTPSGPASPVACDRGAPMCSPNAQSVAAPFVLLPNRQGKLVPFHDCKSSSGMSGQKAPADTELQLKKPELPRASLPPALSLSKRPGARRVFVARPSPSPNGYDSDVFRPPRLS